MQPINENIGRSGLASPSTDTGRAQTPGDIQSIDFMTVLNGGEDGQQKPPIPVATPDAGLPPLPQPVLQPDDRMPVVAVAITAQDVCSIGVGSAPSEDSRLNGNGESAPALLLRLYEQHAVANPFLSMISPGQDAHATGVPTPSQTVQSAPLPVQLSEPSEPASVEVTAQEPTLGRVVAEAATEASTSTNADLPEHDWSAPLIGSVAAESQLWLQRLAKVTTSSEGKVTLWIRDYRAPVSSSSEAIESFRAYAREQGLDVHRIVMNGVEIWRHNAVQGEV